MNDLLTVKTTPNGLQDIGLGNLTRKAHLLAARLTWDVQVHSIAHSIAKQKMELELPGWAEVPLRAVVWEDFLCVFDEKQQDTSTKTQRNEN